MKANIDIVRKGWIIEEVFERILKIGVLTGAPSTKKRIVKGMHITTQIQTIDWARKVNSVFIVEANSIE